jgi:hypothetical protein
MRKTKNLSIAAVLLASLGGCLVSDQLTTFTIHPDGSADLVKFQSNIRSTEPGRQGAEELKRYAEDFDARRDPDSLQVTAAGGQVLETRWLRREEPSSNVMVARLPGEAALLAYFTHKDDKGEAMVQPRFEKAGNRRRLSLQVTLPKGDSQPLPDLRQEQASGLSEIRLAVAGGRILAARGFTVAADRRSALIGHAEVRELLQSGKEKAELLLEWELVGE